MAGGGSNTGSSRGEASTSLIPRTGGAAQAEEDAIEASSTAQRPVPTTTQAAHNTTPPLVISDRILQSVASGTATMPERLTFQYGVVVSLDAELQAIQMQRFYAGRPSQSDQRKARQLQQELHVCLDLYNEVIREAALGYAYSSRLGSGARAFRARGAPREQLRLIRVIASETATPDQRRLYATKFRTDDAFQRLVIREYTAYCSRQSFTGYTNADHLRTALRHNAAADLLTMFPHDPLVDYLSELRESIRSTAASALARIMSATNEGPGLSRIGTRRQ
jgi:hypothetical protein